MLAKFFNAMLITSFVGSIFFILLLIIKPFTKKCFNSKWHYYMYLMVVIVFLVPIKANVKTQINVKPIETIYVTRYIPYENNNVNEQLSKSEKDFTVNLPNIWFCVSALLLFEKLGKYIAFSINLIRKSKSVSCPLILMFTNRKVRVRRCEFVSSPFMTGVFLPIIYLPKTDISNAEMEYVLNHEITHLKRCDILIKWVVTFLKCVHWFNPIVYFLSSEINQWCEISCDVSVAESMDIFEKQGYISTIVKLIEKARKKQAFTTSMASNKKLLSKRFYFIQNAKRQKFSKSFVAYIFSFIMIVAFLCSSAVLAGSIESEAKKVSKTEKVLNKIVNVNADTTRKDNDEYKSNNEMTLNEQIKEEDALTIEEFSKSEISKEIVESEKTELKSETTPQHNVDYYAGDVLINEYNQIMDTGDVINAENSNSVLWKSPSNVVDLKTSHTWFDYSFDNEFSYTVTVIPDENGMISLFFDTEFAGATADVYINHENRQKMGWGYRFPTDSKKLYKFCGFEKNQKYEITVSSYFPGNYNIKGKALII